jgi:hypothetical protein
MRRFLAMALAVLFCSAVAIAERAVVEHSEGIATCEPAADLELTVKTLPVAEIGSRPVVLIELTAISQVDLTSIRISGRRRAAMRPALAFQVVDDHRPANSSIASSWNLDMSTMSCSPSAVKTQPGSRVWQIRTCV